MSATQKCSVDSSGMVIEVLTSGAGARLAIDCPLCKYGTLESVGALAFVCIDCGNIVQRKELIDAGIIAARRSK